MLLFYSGNDRFAISTEQVVEVFPHVPLKMIYNLPPHICGLLNYSNESISIIDWTQLIQGHPCSNAFYTRIILIDPSKEENQKPQLGIIAEKVIQTMEIKESELNESHMPIEGKPFLRGLTNAQGLIQIVDADMLLKYLHESLFTKK